MITKYMFKMDGPLLVDPKLGREPSLKELIYEYYIKFLTEERAKESTEQYIEALIKNLKE